MRCPNCRSQLGPEARFCSECGAPLPQASPQPDRRMSGPFAETERRFVQLRARYQAGQLDDAAYEAQLKRLIIEDHAGEYWMLGADSGEWYWYDGERWLRRDPGLPDCTARVVPAKPRTAAKAPPRSRPSTSALWRWVFAGCGGLIVLLILAGVGMLIAWRGRLQSARAGVTVEPTTATAPFESPSAVVIPTTPVSISALIEEDTALQTPEPSRAPTRQPTPAPNPTPATPFSIRPYDADRDAEIESLLQRVDDFLDPAEPGDYQWQVAFPADVPALLDMSWCSADHSTLEDNWSQVAHELWIDGFPVPLSRLAEMSWTKDELICHGYRGVLTGWEREPHSVQWTRHIYREINDGLNTYAAGDYLVRFEVEMVNMFHEQFNDVSGGWIEGDYESDRVWIEDGEYHVLLKEPQRLAAVAHSEHRYADFYVVAQARQVGEVGGEYGVVFRYQDPQNTYYFRVSHDGRYRIGKRVDGEWIDLVGWTFSDVVNKAQSGNVLWVMCDGSEITAFVNDEEIATVDDGAFLDGYVGVTAGSFDQPDVHIAFDYIVVEAMSVD